MGVQERKIKEKKMRMEDIINAAEQVFLNKGIDAATMDEIAGIAEFSKRTVYIYFKSKEELMLAVGIRGYRIFNRWLEESLTDGTGKTSTAKTGADKVMAIGKNFIRLFREHPLYFQIILTYQNRDSDLSLDSEILRENYTLGEVSFQLAVQAIEEGKDDGSIDPGLDTVPSVVFLWSAITGLLTMLSRKLVYIEGFQHTGTEQVLDESLRLIRKAISGDRGTK